MGYFPATGARIRESGNFNYVGSWSELWWSGIGGTNIVHGANMRAGEMVDFDGNPRAYAWSVRCVQKFTTFSFVLSYERIGQLAAAEGFARWGVARVRPLSEYADPLMRWLSEGWNGGLGYMEREPMRRIDLRQLIPEARSVIVCAMRYENRSAASRHAARSVVRSTR